MPEDIEFTDQLDVPPLTAVNYAYVARLWRDVTNTFHQKMQTIAATGEWDKFVPACWSSIRLYGELVALWFCILVNHRKLKQLSRGSAE